MADAPKTPPTMPTVAELMQAIASLKADMDALKAQPPAEPVRIPGTPPARKAWDEVIWVEALNDCVYPDPGDTYGKYRKAAENVGDRGEIFRLRYREDMNSSMREVSGPQAGQADPQGKSMVPQQANRNPRQNTFR